MKTKFVTLALTACFCLGYRQVEASVIAIAVTGHVTSFGYYSGPMIDVPVGTVFTGIYTYETTTPNSSSVPYKGEYLHYSPSGFDICVGDYEFKTATSSGLFMRIMNNYTDSFGNIFDQYYITSTLTSPLPEGSLCNIVWNLKDNTHVALSSIIVPETAPNLSMWNENHFQISSGNAFLLDGIITQASVVPEPLTVTLMSLSAIILIKRNR